MHKIINSDQNGYIKNRYIGFNIRQIQDIIDYADKFNVEGAILFLDFSKAFDSLEREFMYLSLEKFGFKKSIIKWLRTLYSNIKGCILNNGWISSPFKINRGNRQGCPLSTLIFVIAVEILACRIRQDKNLKGIQIKLDGRTHSLKLSQLADDTTVFVQSKIEISIAFNIIETFGSFSGLILNRNKTEDMWIGCLKHCKDKIENINWVTDYVKCLGIYFGHNKAECKKLNIEKQLLKSEKIINSWKKRNITMVGKIMIVKSLIIPNITYVASVTNLDKEYVSKFKTMIYKFIWNDKREKVKRETMNKNYLEGGLKMIDIDKYIEAIQIKWIKKLTSKNFANWKVIPFYYFNKFGPELMIFNMSIDTIKSVDQFTNNLSDYYLNLLKSWISINKYTKIPSNFRTIRQEIIWGNQHIKFKNKSLIYLNWINDGIIFINDIIDHEGKLSENFILKKLSLKTNWISEFTKLKKSIPKKWLNELESENSTKTAVKTNKILYINENSKKKLQDCNSQDIYKTPNIMNKNIKEHPTGFMKWRQKLGNTICIKDMLKFTFRHLKENKLKIFRWKLLHFILPCM